MPEEKPAETPPEIPPETQPPSEEPKEPAYFSQFTKEFRESPEAKKLYGYGKPEPLAKALLEAHGKLERAILVPSGEKPDPEEVKAFRARLGIPEKETGYEFPAESIKGLPEESLAGFRKLFHSAGLTKPQAATVFAAVVAGQKQTTEARAEAEKQRGEAYQEALLKLGGGDPEKAKGVEQLYKLTLAKHFGSKDLIRRIAAAGLLNDPEFAASIVATGRLLKDDTFTEGSEGGKAGAKAKLGTMGNYSPEWQARMKGEGA